ncbi:phosphatidylglycerol:prolipoprotein diacylglycerol transferase [Rubritalea squalenifaciens DSM 18772]|uniref:Phosphatidylglycerol--prolipoprotein diacylglyceryl transferase n=1 Tax=Rubritalea squalenifaciens DSM 18772 TaxID=1123071 RepID=A0A1M6QJ52_9BACT|nr:prolipoprotein diacylglyceryl transferase [Rubritalea squalenifaciens]SHK20150.1 phosphatidylglycerol:prolipoprotein diacylglycerol transferase [Rubritalea squalenifaciens DSM 18772]
MLATYIHDLDPVIFSITDSIKLRWYGLAYLLAFVVGYYLLKWLGNKKLWVLPGNQAGDFIAYAAFFGVFLGGRIGNVLIYQRAELMEDPSMIFRVWEGGMASHGGILGLMIFTLVYSRMKKVSWTGLGDALCVVAPLGLMFGRIANFINGELYGRIDRGFAWAMKFPETMWEPGAPESERVSQAMLAAVDADPRGTYAKFYNEMGQGIGPETGALNREALLQGIRESDKVKEAVGQYLEPRYPSQLFQAALEGLALFLILFAVRMKFPKLAHGVLTGLFFIFYAIFRISMENFREPEIVNRSYFGIEITEGQFWSIFMIFIGLAFLVKAKISVGKKSIFNHGGL